MNIKKSTLFSVLSKGFSTLVVFGIVVISARIYGKEGRGEISLFTANYTFILHFCSIIGGSALVYLYHQKSMQKIVFLFVFVDSWSLYICFCCFITFF